MECLQFPWSTFWSVKFVVKVSERALVSVWFFSPSYHSLQFNRYHWGKGQGENVNVLCESSWCILRKTSKLLSTVSKDEMKKHCCAKTCLFFPHGISCSNEIFHFFPQNLLYVLKQHDNSSLPTASIYTFTACIWVNEKHLCIASLLCNRRGCKLAVLRASALCTSRRGWGQDSSLIACAPEVLHNWIEKWRAYTGENTGKNQKGLCRYCKPFGGRVRNITVLRTVKRSRRRDDGQTKFPLSGNSVTLNEE